MASNFSSLTSLLKLKSLHLCEYINFKFSHLSLRFYFTQIFSAIFIPTPTAFPSLHIPLSIKLFVVFLLSFPSSRVRFTRSYPYSGSFPPHSPLPSPDGPSCRSPTPGTQVTHARPHYTRLSRQIGSKCLSLKYTISSFPSPFINDRSTFHFHQPCLQF